MPENTINDASSTTVRTKKQDIFIEPEYVIVNLMQADKKKYLTIPRLFRFIAYLRQQLSDMDYLPSECAVIFDINFDSIERTVRYHKTIFGLIGDTIVMKEGTPPVTPDNLSKFLPKIAEEFAEKFAA
jgi:hypothetical protein